MSSFGTKLKALREANHISQAELASRIGVSRSAISMYEQDERVAPYEIITSLCEILETEMSYLLADDPLYQAAINYAYKGVLIPVLGYIRAGIPIDAVEEILDYEEISKEMARKGEHFGLTVKGDSMEPRFREGDVVIVRKQSDIKSGEIAIVLVNGQDATIKKFVKHENGVSLIATNPMYEPMFYTAEEVNKLPVEVIGKVVELRAKF